MAKQNDTFLPEDYSGVPKEPSNYMQFSEGENRFRAMSSAITGYEYWIDDAEGRRPVRVRLAKNVPSEYFKAKDTRNKAKYFWAFVVWNYQLESLQILEIKQKGIMTDLEALVQNPKWGSPKEYDIVITKKKTGSEARDVEYATMPDPKEPMNEGIMQFYKDSKVRLEALYEGKNPFDEDDNAEDIASDAEAEGL